MTGKTHKAIGIATGVSMTLVGASTGMPLLALGMVTAPIGAMLPDIDHNNSRIGRKRKSVVDFIVKFGKVAIVIAIIITLLVGYFKGLFVEYLIKTMFIVGPLVICMYIASNPKLKSKSKFFTKHRGIMHTLIPPLCMLVGSYTIKVNVLQQLILGLAIGYISHLVADMCTVMGCPVAWPITEKCISILPIKTGTAGEYILVQFTLNNKLF